MQTRCQNCHRPGEAAPFSMLTYKDARPWAKAMKEAVLTKKMPPWFADPAFGHFSNDRRLAPEEVNTLVSWVDQGALEGDPKDAPQPLEFHEGWTALSNTPTSCCPKSSARTNGSRRSKCGQARGQ